MQVIFSKRFQFRTDADIRAYLAMFAVYAVDPNHDPDSFIAQDFVQGDVDDIRIGNAQIFVKRVGEDKFTRIGLRKDFAGAMVDGKPFVLHGPDFHRFHCVCSQERYDAQAQKLRDEADIRKQYIREVADRRIAETDDWLAHKLERLGLEFRIDQGDPRYVPTATEETATEETAEEA